MPFCEVGAFRLADMNIVTHYGGLCERSESRVSYAPTGVEATSREEAEEAAGQLAMMHGPTAPFWHTVTFHAVPSQAEQAYANDPDHLTVGARRWPILWEHKATYTMGVRS